MDNDTLSNKIQKILPILNEKQKRIFLASEAQSLGYGGISKISKLSGVSRPTISQGIKELNSNDYIDHEKTVRGKGGGPKSIHRENKKLKKQIESIIEPATTGDPMSPLRWTIKSTREIEKELNEAGYYISHQTIATILQDIGYSLQSNSKSLNKKQHPDRNKQFEHINNKINEYFANNNPVISVDAKKKERLPT